MKMAKASDKNRDAVKDFLGVLDAIEEYGSVEINGKEWKPTDEQLGAYVLDWLRKNPVALMRVVWGFETLVENVCDPNVSYLEWRPDIKAAMEAAGIKDE